MKPDPVPEAKCAVSVDDLKGQDDLCFLVRLWQPSLGGPAQASAGSRKTIRPPVPGAADLQLSGQMPPRPSRQFLKGGCVHRWERVRHVHTGCVPRVFTCVVHVVMRACVRGVCVGPQTTDVRTRGPRKTAERRIVLKHLRWAPLGTQDIRSLETPNKDLSEFSACLCCFGATGTWARCSSFVGFRVLISIKG